MLLEGYRETSSLAVAALLSPYQSLQVPIVVEAAVEAASLFLAGRMIW